MRRKAFRFHVTTLAGSTLKNIRALEQGHQVEARYRFKYMATLGVAGLLEVLNLTERLATQKRIREYTFGSPPVFIIGFWRSGTTLLHNLLCQDPQAAYTTTFQTVFPNLVLTQSWWLKPVVNMFLPPERPYDNVSMDMDFPQEEDFGMMNLQPTTIYKFFIYPGDFDRIVSEELFTARISPEKLALWKAAYRSMMVKAIFNTGGIRYIGKNPCHLARIGLMLEMFPDAKFIFIHRHPYKVIESLYHFILSIFPGVQLQDIPDTYTRQTVVDLYRKSLDAYFSTRSLIPPENLIEIKLDDFQMDIAGNMHKVYEKFNLGDYLQVSGRIDKFIAANPAPDRNAVPPSPETIRLVKEQAGHIIQQLGYDR
jgi:hypothetical protein